MAPASFPKLPRQLKNELAVFITINTDRNITFRRAVEVSGLPKSTFAGALGRLVDKGVVANESGKGKKANYKFDEIAVKGFLDELSPYFRTHETYNKLEHGLKMALEKEHENEIKKNFIKISAERLCKEAKKRAKKELVTKTSSLELDEMPPDTDFTTILQRYNQRMPNESELSYWKRKLIEIQNYPLLDGLFFTEKEIRRSIKTYERLVVSSQKSRLLTEKARKKAYE